MCAWAQHACSPKSVRETGNQPWVRQASKEEFAEALVEEVAAAQQEIGDRRLVVIVPASRYDELTTLLAASLPDVAFGTQPSVLDSTTVVLDVSQSKGLEFDSVVIADPGAIIRDSTRGMSDLYVAVTRSTTHLGVVTSGEVPMVLARAAVS